MSWTLCRSEIMGPEIYDKMHHMAYLSNALPGYAGRWFCCRCHFHSGLVNILGTFHRHVRGITTDIVHEEGKRKFPLYSRCKRNVAQPMFRFRNWHDERFRIPHVHTSAQRNHPCPGFGTRAENVRRFYILKESNWA